MRLGVELGRKSGLEVLRLPLKCKLVTQAALVALFPELFDFEGGSVEEELVRKLETGLEAGPRKAELSLGLAISSFVFRRHGEVVFTA